MDASSKLYDDINLFTLSGVNELSRNNISYPYIEIDNAQTDIVLVKYHASKEVTYTEKYTNQDGVWASRNFVEEGNDTTYFYKFVFQDNIVRLRYKGNPEGSSFELMTLSVMDETFKEVSYVFAEGLKEKPTTNIDKLLANKVIRHVYMDYLIVDENLTVSNKVVDDLSKKIVLEENACYKIGKHSFFWWDYFGPLTTEVDCN